MSVFNPTAPVPAHVPRELVFDYDPQIDPEYESAGWAVFLKGKDLPPIFWSPVNGGGWIVTRADLMEEIFLEHELFSSKNASLGIFGRRVLPADSDPPEHRRYRSLVNPAFGPVAVRAKEAEIRAIASGLVDAVADRGACNFIEAVANVLPTLVFTSLVGVPREDAEKLRAWVAVCLSGWTLDGERKLTIDAVIEYLRELIAARRAHSGEDLVSHILGATTPEGPLSDEEALDFVYLLFLGGLDSLGSSMGHVFFRLARHAEERAAFRALLGDRAALVLRLEEYFRLHPVLRTVRHVTRDVDFHGVVMRIGDAVVLQPAYANYDAGRFPEPMKVTPDESRAHLTFAVGPHHCLGARLARLEMQLLVEEWFRRIPEFRLQTGAPAPRYLRGSVNLSDLHLQWER